MTVLRHNFDGGPHNTTLTVANSAQVVGNDPFDVVTISGTGTTGKYTSADDRGSAEYVFTTQTGSGTNYSYAAWTTSMGAQATIYTRWYAKFSSIPTSNSNDNTLFMCWNGATHCCSVWMTNIDGTVGTAEIMNSPTSVITESTAVLAEDVWHRFEFRATMSATVGSSELRLYLHPNEDGLEPDDVVTQSGQNYASATANHFRLGNGNPLTNQSPTHHTSWELNNTGWPGPAPFKVKGVPGILANPVAIHTDVW